MATYDDKWFEIWYSEGTEVIPHYLLIVTTDEKDRGKIIVVDPQKKNEICFRAKDYNEVCVMVKKNKRQNSALFLHF